MPPSTPQLSLSEPLEGAGTIRAHVTAPPEHNVTVVFLRWQSGTGNGWPSTSTGIEFAPETDVEPNEYLEFDEQGFSQSSTYEIACWARDAEGATSIPAIENITTGTLQPTPAYNDPGDVPVPLRRGPR